MQPIPDHLDRRDRQVARAFDQVTRGRPARRRAGPAAGQHQRDLHQPVASQPVADRGPAELITDLENNEADPDQLEEPLPAGPPRHPYAGRKAARPPGPRRRGARTAALGPAGPAGRRAARRLLRGGAVRGVELSGVRGRGSTAAP
ncbi:hypothetical protein LV779_36940 [Streptomyces thinghirensis]|nr:hypothetical protein [Streptomyces thinghirensis]